MLESLLLRLDSPDERLQVVTSEETSFWPEGMLELLCREGLLEEAQPSTTCTCNECGDSHTEEVVVVESPPGSPLRFYIICPSVGHVRVDPEELRQWRLVPEGWAKFAGRLLGTSEQCRELTPERMWSLGLTDLGGSRRELLFARGVSWPSDGSSLAARTSGGAIPPAVLVPCELRDSPVSCSLPLERVLGQGDGSFSLDRGMVDFLTASWPRGAPTPEIELEGKAVFSYSDGFRSVTWNGEEFEFTAQAAHVISILYRAYEQGMPLVEWRVIKAELEKLGHYPNRMADIFKNTTGEKAWRRLVISGGSRGLYRLAP